MFPGSMQAAILTVIVLLCQTTQRIHCEDAPSNVVDESHILSLTKDTFDDAVKNNKYLFVKFVAPWCGHCKTLIPAYAAAAKELSESGSGIVFASVDATNNQELAKEHGVKGYPTMKFFKNGTKIDYKAGRAQSDMIRWLKKKTGPPAAELNTVDDLNKLKESDDVIVIGAFKDINSEAGDVFLQVADSIDDIMFGITSNSDVLKELGVKEDTVVLLKEFDEGRNDLPSPFNQSSIEHFIAAHDFPNVIDFSLESADKIFGGEMKIQMLFFGNTKSDDYEKQEKEFDAAAKEFRQKVRFVFVDTGIEENTRLSDYFGIKKTDIPTIRLITFVGEDTIKYKPESSDIKSGVLIKFVNDYFDGKLRGLYSSQEIPEDWDKGSVKILVGKNFAEVAYDKTKTVLAAFVASWCGHCKELAPIIEELGEKYKDNKDVIIAKIDATVNEVENIRVPLFPTIKLFPKDSDAVIAYDGARTVSAFSKFIDSNGAEIEPQQSEKQPEEVKGEGQEEEEEVVGEGQEEEQGEGAEDEEDDDEEAQIHTDL